MVRVIHFPVLAVTALLTLAPPCAWSEDATAAFANPQPVTLIGYSGHAMEPFISPDGRVLLFNNSNDPKENTDLHWAERETDLTFRYRGKIATAPPQPPNSCRAYRSTSQAWSTSIWKSAPTETGLLASMAI